MNWWCCNMDWFGFVCWLGVGCKLMFVNCEFWDVIVRVWFMLVFVCIRMVMIYGWLIGGRWCVGVVFILSSLLRSMNGWYFFWLIWVLVCVLVFVLFLSWWLWFVLLVVLFGKFLGVVSGLVGWCGLVIVGCCWKFDIKFVVWCFCWSNLLMFLLRCW